MGRRIRWLGVVLILCFGLVIVQLTNIQFRRASALATSPDNPVNRAPNFDNDRGMIFAADGTPLPHDQCPMAVALKGAEVTTGIECIAERPDGTRFWFTPCPAVIRDAEGRIIGGINFCDAFDALTIAYVLPALIPMWLEAP